MGKRTLTCADCGRQWAPRDARFCGACGAILDRALVTGDPARGQRRLRALVGVASAAAVAATIAGGVVELRPPTLTADPTIDLADEPAGILELSPDEERALRADADPDRLRCEPRGCERWRVPRPGAGQPPISTGAVLLERGLVLLLGHVATEAEEERPTVDGVDDTRDDTSGAGGDDNADATGDETAEETGDIGRLWTRTTYRTIVAIDVETGERRWERVIPPPEADWIPDDASARLLPGPQGALLLADGAFTSLDQDGEVVWRWGATHPAGLPYRPWAATQHGEDMLVVADLPGQPGDRTLVAALDGRTGEPRWIHHAREVALLEEDLVVTLNSAGELGAVDLDDGQVRWQRPVEDGEGLVHRVGPWIAHRRASGSHELIDPSSGEVVEELLGYLVTTADDEAGRVAAIVSGALPDTLPPDGGAAQLGILVLDPSGRIAWQLPLGEIDPWWTCCHLEVTEETITVTSARFNRTFDAVTGELVAAEPTVPDDVPEPASTHELQGARWYPTQDLDLEVAWHRDGRGLELHRDQATVTIRGDGRFFIETFDPVIVSDGQTLMGVRFPDQGEGSAEGIEP